MSNRIETLLEQLHDWRFKTGKYLEKYTVGKLEEQRLLPTFYRTEAWFLTELAKEWELNSETNVFPVPAKKKEYLVAEKI